MKDSLDLRFNRGGSEGEVGSTKSPSEPTCTLPYIIYFLTL
jgi:hypothetical protein